MAARIYKTFKNITQSGQRFKNIWVLEFLPNYKAFIEPVMGWTSGSDTVASEVKLQFNSLEAAIKYANNINLSYEIIETSPLVINYNNNYLNNFSA